MPIKESGENYLETIYILQKEKGMVRSIDVANALGFSKPSISRAVSLLKQDGAISVDITGSITLTEKGLQVGQRIAEKIDRIIDEAGEGVSDECREIMYRSLFMINSNLQKRCSAYEK